jgi:ribosomal-protein-alanine N-acetyltransferase
MKIILETERLILRQLTADDLDDLATLYGDPEVRRYSFDGTLSYEQTREELEFFLDEYTKHPQIGLWATIHKPSGRFIGRCGLLSWTIDGRPEIEIAYMLAQAWWRQGLGSEAARGIRNYGFNTLQLSRLICLINRDNQASIAVARSIGMSFEKEGRVDEGPFMLYSMSKPSA